MPLTSTTREEWAWFCHTAEDAFNSAVLSCSLSGWSGEEVSAMPQQAWDIFASLVNTWLERGEVPSVWSCTRQVHLQKPDAVLRGDGAISAKDMRPIAFQSV